MTEPKINFRQLRVRGSLAVIAVLLGGLLAACGSGVSGRNSTTPPHESTLMRDNRLLVERGRIAARRFDTVRAEHYFSLALEHGFDREALLPELLSVCLSSLRLRSALNYAESYLRQHPKNSALRYLVATLHLGLGQTVMAKQELVTLLRHDNTFANAHFLLGNLELPSAVDSARRHLVTYLELRPNGDKVSEVRERLEQMAFEAKVNRVALGPRSVTNSLSHSPRKQAPVPARSNKVQP